MLTMAVMCSARAGPSRCGAQCKT